MSQKKFGKAIGGASQDLVSHWENDQVQPPPDRLDKMLKLVDESYSLPMCLVLPWEAPEAERKLRTLETVFRQLGIATPVVPVNEKDLSKILQPVKFKQKPKARKVEPLRTKAQVANYGRKKRDGP